MATLAAVVAVLIAAPARLEATLETGGRVASGWSNAQGASRSIELEPGLAAQLADELRDLKVRYSPRLILTDARPGSALGVRHAGLVEGRLRQSRRLELVVSERFRYGRNDPAWDAGDNRLFDVLETLLPLIPDDLSSASAVGFSHAASPNVSLNGSLGYLAYGGVSAASQQLFPFQHGPQLYLGIDHELSRNDRLSTELYGSHAFATGGRRSSLLKLTQAWRRLFSSTTRGKLSAGLSGYRRGRLPDAGEVGLYPVVAAALEHDLLDRWQRLELRASAALAPHNSPLTAELRQRAELAGAARWSAGRLSMRGRVAAARELGGAQLLLGALDVALQIRPDLSLAAGTQAIWQDLPTQARASAFRWMGFTALRVGSQLPL